MPEARTILKAVKEYSVMTVGLFFYVLGWVVFLVPNNLIGGGVTGLASIVQYATGGFIKIGATYFVVNVALLITALFILGKGFGFKTVYAVAAVSLGLSVVPGIIPQEFIQTIAIDNGKLMSTIMGGIMCGVGIGVSISQGGSTGGTDIVALIINKYRNISPGRVILSLDVFILLSSLLVPSYTADGVELVFTDKLVNVVYGLILVIVNSTVLDLYLSGSRQSVQIFIFSHRHEEIADMITHDLNKGVTALDGRGWYTKTSQQILMVVVRKADLNLVLRSIKAIDPDAFISVSSATAVYGKGFDKIKGAKKA